MNMNMNMNMNKSIISGITIIITIKGVLLSSIEIKYTLI